MIRVLLNGGSWRKATWKINKAHKKGINNLIILGTCTLRKHHNRCVMCLVASRYIQEAQRSFKEEANLWCLASNRFNPLARMLIRSCCANFLTRNCVICTDYSLLKPQILGDVVATVMGSFVVLYSLFLLNTKIHRPIVFKNKKQ